MRINEEMKKPALPFNGRTGFSMKIGLYCFFDFAGTEAGGADIRTLCFAFNKDTLALKVGLENAVGCAVRVADGASGNRGFTAH